MPMKNNFFTFAVVYTYLKPKQMKKVFTFLTAFAFIGLGACGSPAEDKETEEAATQAAADSVANALLEQASEMAEESEMVEEAEPMEGDSTEVSADAEMDGEQAEGEGDGEDQ